MKILVTHGGQPFGPYTPEQAQAALQSGVISPTDLAWVEGTPSWQPLSTVLNTVTTGVLPNLYGTPRPVVFTRSATPTSGLAIASFALGLASLCFGILTGLPAILYGHRARRQIQRAPDQWEGAGLALAGLILGYFFTVLSVIVILAIGVALLAPALAGRHSQTNQGAATTQIMALQRALDSFPIGNGKYRAERERPKALVAPPGKVAGSIFKKVRVDSWGAVCLPFALRDSPKEIDFWRTEPPGGRRR